MTPSFGTGSGSAESTPSAISTTIPQVATNAPRPSNAGCFV
jgi:hypothetical protein